MSKARNLAIIQARTGSTRLPDKVLMDLQGVPVLEHVVNRVKQSELIDGIVVATTIAKSDLRIVRYCVEKGIRVFVGSENDVLDRYYQVAKLVNFENIVRITADCPMMDASIIDKVVLAHEKGYYDYTSNTLEETYPDGEDVEVVSFDALKEAWNLATMASQREHVTQYIIHNEKYKKHSVRNSTNLGDKRWTLDTPNDYKFISKIFDRLYKQNKYFSMEEVLALLKVYPDLEMINNDSKRNEGLKKSLKNDNKIERE